MIKILHGNDEFALATAVKNLKKGSQEAGLGDADFAEIQGAKTKLTEIVGVAATPPFLSERRVVLVYDLIKTLSASKNDFDAERLSQSVHPKTELVLVENQIVNSSTINSLGIAKLGQITEFKLPVRRADIIAKIKAMFEAHGVFTTGDVHSTMHDLLGAQLRRIDSEIQKLKIYADGRELTSADLHKMVRTAREENIFRLIDCIFEGRTDAALSGFHNLVTQGEQPSSVIHLMARHNRLLLLTKHYLSQPNFDHSQLGSFLNISHSFLIDKLKAQARKFAFDDLANLHQRLYTTDKFIKTGVLDEFTAIETLIIA